jgi:hypothetical protein
MCLRHESRANAFDPATIRLGGKLCTILESFSVAEHPGFVQIHSGTFEFVGAGSEDIDGS